MSLTEAGLEANLGSVLRELEANTAIVGRCEADEALPAQSRLQAARGARQGQEAFCELDSVTIADLVNERQAGNVAVGIGLAPPRNAFV